MASCSSPQQVHDLGWWEMLCSFWCRHLPQKKQNIHQPAGLTSAKRVSPVLPPHSPRIPTCLHAPTHARRHDACTHDACTDHVPCRLLSHPCTSSASLLPPGADSSAPQCSRKLTQKKLRKPSRKQKSLWRQLFCTSAVPAI